MAGGYRLELSLTSGGSTTTTSTAEEPRARPSYVATQREQRRVESALYAELAALLPGLNSSSRPSRVDIVDAAVAHVRVLEDTAAVLDAYRAVHAHASAGAGVAVSSRVAVCFAARLPAPGALRRVLEAFDLRGVEVLAATLASSGGSGDATVTVTAATAGPEVVAMIKNDIASIE